MRIKKLNVGQYHISGTNIYICGNSRPNQWKLGVGDNVSDAIWHGWIETFKTKRECVKFIKANTVKMMINGARYEGFKNEN